MRRHCLGWNENLLSHLLPQRKDRSEAPQNEALLEESAADIAHVRKRHIDQLFYEYFSESPRYSKNMLQSRHLWCKPTIFNFFDVVKFEVSYFQILTKCTKKRRLEILQMVAAVMPVSAYIFCANPLCNTVKIAERKALECLHHFSSGFVPAFE